MDNKLMHSKQEEGSLNQLVPLQSWSGPNNHVFGIVECPRNTLEECWHIACPHRRTLFDAFGVYPLFVMSFELEENDAVARWL
jgi:hypothetical protein